MKYKYEWKLTGYDGHVYTLETNVLYDEFSVCCRAAVQYDVSIESAKRVR